MDNVYILESFINSIGCSVRKVVNENDVEKHLKNGWVFTSKYEKKLYEERNTKC